MNILITGSEGFIGKNLHIYFSEKKEIKLFLANRKTTPEEFEFYIREADWIIHVAGTNRPLSEEDFIEGNANTTKKIVEALVLCNKATPIIYSSSIQAELNNPYGKSKRDAELLLLDYSKKTNASVYIYRLPNVFGKFAKPNYNSVVATFCYNISRSLPVEIHDPSKILSLAFIEDVCIEFDNIVHNRVKVETAYPKFEFEYSISLQKLADKLYQYKEVRSTLSIPEVGNSFERALYSTFISYLPIEECQYSIPEYRDPRGRFVEMLKTESSGQFSFFTAPPGITRGRHYHNTKTEKFLIIQGRALFRFQHYFTKEYHEITVDGSNPKIVDTIPGWTHDITNVGENELIVMLWANEVFDRNLPDTFSAEISK
ncbi:polysaccharide biosynthesis C-terminal domain-containing protein [Leptospira kanakyensis]|uniref:polysaccharide biosynthesis C-terminal domain-containing protein n=1 Tax=Leptospira kanakyensis TaxID=2484968 RepID=UPI00223E1088|nr:NAD-dependent epimerase/dehydratase family protein [Leptospira kanakyensis]MCW7471379.1 NAD-dependent epimerase/dehydratase family protein [Leptospira kanakyensis]